MTGPTFDGRDDYLPNSTLDLIDAVWSGMPDEWEVPSMQGHMRSVTATVRFLGVVGPESQNHALEELVKAATCVGALARNLRYEREQVTEAAAILADEFGHAEAVHNPLALEALNILQSLARDEVGA